MIGHVTLDELIRLTHGFRATCTIKNPKRNSVTFAKDERWLSILSAMSVDLFTLVPKELSYRAQQLPVEVKKKIRPIVVDGLIKTFVLFHNEVNRHRTPAANEFAPSVVIHPTAVIGAEGMRFVRGESGLVRMKHMGNIVMRDAVEVGPLSIVNRGTIDSTVLMEEVKIGGHCNVGHNVEIGAGTMLAENVHIGGSAKIGEGCWFGMGALVRDNIKIASGVRLGIGSVASKDIEKPGTYVGSPARRIGGYDGEW